MAKQLKFEYKGVEYTLEFNKKSVETMEKQGFKASEITDKPMSTLPLLFSGAFIMHHRFVKKKLIDEIYEHMTNKEDLIGNLAEMYNEPIESLVSEPEEGAEGNVTWTATW